MSCSYTDLIKERLIPRLEQGAKKGRLELSKEDCERLLFVFRTSVPLEPFIVMLSDLVKKTWAEFEKEGTVEDEKM